MLQVSSPLETALCGIWLDAGGRTSEPARARIGVLSFVFVVMLRHYGKPPASLPTEKALPLSPSGPRTAVAPLIYTRYTAGYLVPGTFSVINGVKSAERTTVEVNVISTVVMAYWSSCCKGTGARTHLCECMLHGTISCVPVVGFHQHTKPELHVASSENGGVRGRYERVCSENCTYAYWLPGTA